MLEKQIAVLARELVEARRSKGIVTESETEYRSLCESFPVLLRTSGLTRSITFLDAKKKVDKSGSPDNAQAFVLAHLQQHMEELGVLSGKPGGLAKLVVEPALTTADYRRVSYLVLRAAYWHKRLAQALLRQREARA